MKKMISQKLLRNAVMLTCMLCSANAYADKPLEEFVFDPMLVTATRYDTREVDIPAATEVFDREKIEKLGANNVMEVVRNVPGFTLTASPTGNTYIGFRGMSKDHVVILVNGIPLNQDGNYDLESISTDIIDRIEVVKGGSTVLYGSNASAGVVNIITNKNAKKTKVMVGAGDNHKFKGAVSIATDKLQLSYSRSQAKDRGIVYMQNPTSYYLGDKVEKDSLNVQYEFDEHVMMQYMHSTKVSDCSKLVKGQIMPGFHSDIKYDFGQVRYTNNDLQASAYIRYRDWKFNTNTHQKGTNYGLDIQDKLQAGIVNVTVGANYDKEDTENSGKTYAAKRDSAAAFFMTETPIGENTKLFVGAREAYVEESGSKFCPQLQVLHSLGEDDNVYVNVNKSMRAPNVNEQWGTASQVMNPELKAESGWNYEIGWKKKLSDNELMKFNVFHMNIDDRIYRDRINVIGDDGKPDTKNIYRNANKFKNTGIEISYEKAASSKFQYNLGVSFSNPEQQLKGKDWERVDYKLGLNAGFGYSLDNTKINLVANYMAERVNGVKPMLNMNLNVRQKLSENGTLTLNVYNLLDRRDICTGTSNGLSGALLEERNWMISYEHNF